MTEPTAAPSRFALTTSPKSRLPFRNVSGSDSQLAILEQNGEGLCALDFDGDGLLDLYLANGSTLDLWKQGRGPGGALFRNSGDGSFSEVTRRAGLQGPAWATGCAVADYDGDGRPDLFVAGWRGSRLYRNRGDGTFDDVTDRAGLSIPGWASSGAFADLDGDGRLDLAVSRYVDFDPETYPKTDGSGRPCDYKGVPAGCPPIFHIPESTVLFRQRPDGGFEDLSVPSGVFAVSTRGFGLVALPLFVTSHLPDIYVACDQMANRLFRNRTANRIVRFEEVAEELGAAYNFEGAPESGMGLVVGDVWERGWPDLFVTNFSDQKNTLYRNLGELFEDATFGTGLEAHRNELSWGNALADFDADSHLDVVVANGHIYPQVADLTDPQDVYEQPMRLFAGDGLGHFSEIGLPALAERRSRRGLAIADLNNDGRLDLITQTHRGEPQIFWNRSSPGNHWIRFSLRGRAPRDPMGARVTVELADGSRRTAWHLPNQGYQSSQDPRVYFGLGDNKRISSVEVAWPDGSKERYGELAADRDYFIEEGRKPVALRLKSFSVPAGPAS